MKKRIVMEFIWKRRDMSIDIEAPIQISATDLLYGLNKGLHLDLDLSKPEECFLVTENPIALLRGNRTLADYGLHDGTKIYFNR